jgi:hypothetical protein
MGKVNAEMFTIGNRVVVTPGDRPGVVIDWRTVTDGVCYKVRTDDRAIVLVLAKELRREK